MAQTLASGIAIIASYAAILSERPGIYCMFGPEDRLLYVGKAKNLPKRVTSYTDPARLSDRIKRMVAQTVRMEHIYTASELEALLLEAQHIKTRAPKYNIVLRDGKTYPFIAIPTDHPFPRVMKHRGARNENAHYFGPYPSALSVNHAIVDIQRAFGLRPCDDAMFKSRTRPCMEYQIKRCSGPCVGKISEEEYKERIKQALAFLSGKRADLQTELAKKMEEASAAMEFEKAAEYRDRIRALTTVQAKQYVHLTKHSDVDAIALHGERGLWCAEVFFFRHGESLGHHAYRLEPEENQSEAEILHAFLLQLYQHTPAPSHLWLSHDLLEPELTRAALRELAHDSKLSIERPARGEGAEVMHMALVNARDTWTKWRASIASGEELSTALATLLALAKPPNRIEVFDNSHCSGSNEIGAMIVMLNHEFAKKEYRRFTMKNPETATNDDYAMMREMLSRRAARILQQDPSLWPDLWLIDGGKGQLHIAEDVLRAHDLDSKIAVLAIAKGEDRNSGNEEFFYRGTAFHFPPKHPLLFFLERLRDEAHRFAIKSHRAKREHALTRSALDEIPGIGSKRKRALLNHFGSVKMIASATTEDLTKVDGVHEALAQEIWNYFRG